MQLIRLKKNLKKSKTCQSGFGLIEVTISIYILIMGLLGIMSLLHQSLKAQHINENTLVAAQLAQEGVELVRNIRDNNWLSDNSSDWKTDIIGGVGGDVDQAFVIDYLGRTSISPVSGVDDPDAKLYINADNLYTHTPSASSTLFSRIIEKTNPQGSYMEITSRVKWTERGNDHNYVISTRLYDWRNAHR